MFIEKIFYEFYKNEMYGIYAKCIFPIMNKFFYKDVVFKIPYFNMQPYIIDKLPVTAIANRNMAMCDIGIIELNL